ncbi:MAG: extracellular solute-binding protein [Treponema sp.]|nr:extracellular solute-binding protein [Treponema sp.]
MKKVFVMFLVFAVVSGVFAGGGSQGQTSSAPASAQKTVNFWYADSDNMGQYVPDGFADRFQQAYPQYTLNATKISGTAADLETQYNSAKMSGNLPDLCFLTLTSFISLGTSGNFYDISGPVASWTDKSNIMTAALDTGLIQGKYMGVGMVPAPITFVYRTDMFEKAGLDPNKPPTTWKELSDYALKLTIHDAQGNIVQGGLDIPSIDYFLNISEPFMLMNGAKVVDEVTGTPYLDDPAVIGTLDFLYGLYKQGVSLPFNWQNGNTIPFMNGTSAMSFIQVNQYQTLITNRPELKDVVKIAPPVQNSKSAAFCGYRLLTIPAESKNVDGAFSLIKYLMTGPEMTIRMNTCGLVPVRTDMKDAYITANPEYGQQVMDTVAVGKGAFIVPWVASLYKFYGPAYEAIMLGQQTPADAMKQAQQQLVADIKNY